MTSLLLPACFQREPFVSELRSQISAVAPKALLAEVAKLDAASYEKALSPNPKVQPAVERFPDVAALEEGLVACDPSAIEVAVEALLVLEPTGRMALSERVFSAEPWPRLERLTLASLEQLQTDESFRRVLSRPQAGPIVRASHYPNGPALALSRLAESPALAWKSSAEAEPYERMLAEDLITYVGEQKPPGAHKLLQEIVAMSAIRELRRRAVQSLVDWGDEAVHRGLTSLIHEKEPALRWAAIGAEFFLGGDIYDRLGGDELLQDAERASDVLQVLARDFQKVRGQPVRRWVDADPRFIQLALAYQKNRDVRDVAKGLLRHLGAAEIKAADKAGAAANAPSQKAKPTSVRLNKGDREALSAIETALDADDLRSAWSHLEVVDDKLVHRDVLSLAERVAHATMQRIGANLTTIIGRLKQGGYQFAHPDRVSCPLDAAEKSALAELEAGGDMPLTLKTLWQVVGSFDLSGSHPGWSKPACLLLAGVEEPPGGVWKTDPMVLYSPSEVLNRTKDDDSIDWPLWPDADHKAGYSGGREIAAAEPKRTLQATLLHLPPAYGSTLLGYLRFAMIEWGGFPGFHSIDPAGSEVAALRKGLDAF